MAEKNRDNWEGRERRQSSRVDVQIALQLSGSEEGFPTESLTTESINVGAEGIYCQVSHFVPPLTKLQLTMVLPVRDRKGKVKNEVLKTEGVVVRCQPSGGEGKGYRIACFFTGMEQASRDMLSEYVRQHDKS